MSVLLFLRPRAGQASLLLSNLPAQYLDDTRVRYGPVTKFPEPERPARITEDQELVLVRGRAGSAHHCAMAWAAFGRIIGVAQIDPWLWRMS